MAKRHGIEMRRAALQLFDEGYGERRIASKLGVCRSIVRCWNLTYEAMGSEALLGMGSTHRKYDFETKLAAASAVVDSGMAKPDAMKRFGIASIGPLNLWCRAYREGGAEALRPKPKGRPKAAPAPKTREEELERRIAKLEAENAYLKKSIALKAQRRSRTAGKPRP